MKRIIRSVALTAFVGAAALSCSVAQAQSQEIYGGAGTDGLALGYGYSFTKNSNVRAEVDGFSISHDFTAGGLQYDAKLKLMHGALFADFFPAPSIVPFRLTAGVLVGGDNVEGDATSVSGTYSINGVTVPSSGESITAKLKFPTVRPYLGIGFGHNPNTKGLSVAFDAGVAFGKPSVSFDVPANIVAAAGQANVDAEQQSLQSKANSLRFYPIVKVAVTYRF
jgi:hypothetical protein